MIRNMVPIPLRLLLLALSLVAAVFLDVLAFGRSLQPSAILAGADGSAAGQASAWWPSPNPAARTTDGFADLHASVWQFEPAHYWMARTLNEAESPWWNPYSAAGTLGPEILVDIKFSPHVLLTAWWFDASPASFDLGLLLIYAMGVWCMLYVLREILGLGLLPATAGAAAYLLNGFAVPNLSSHIGQPYFFLPCCCWLC
jgi:hypothetical protein